MTPLLAITGLQTRYGRIEAIRGVDLEVYPGEIVTLIGANGAGKYRPVPGGSSGVPADERFREPADGRDRR